LKRRNFPNCIGSVDGKHCCIKCHYFITLLVLLAIADAKGTLICIDVGTCGIKSDIAVFQNSAFGKASLNGGLDINVPHGAFRFPNFDTATSAVESVHKTSNSSIFNYLSPTPS
jgi:hypothetical protein